MGPQADLIKLYRDEGGVTGRNALIGGPPSTSSVKYVSWSMRTSLSAVPCAQTVTGTAAYPRLEEANSLFRSGAAPDAPLLARSHRELQALTSHRTARADP